jgi:hypothetical protein
MEVAWNPSLVIAEDGRIEAPPHPNMFFSRKGFRNFPCGSYFFAKATNSGKRS